jgi:hypothetical protein
MERERGWKKLLAYITGALKHLGYTISDQTVGNILKRHDIPPAPERKKTTTWQEFIRTHMDVLVATDFFTTEVWTWCGLVTYYTRDLIRDRAMSCSFTCRARLGGLQARFSVAHDWMGS